MRLDDVASARAHKDIAGFVKEPAKPRVEELGKRSTTHLELSLAAAISIARLALRCSLDGILCLLQCQELKAAMATPELADDMARPSRRTTLSLMPLAGSPAAGTTSSNGSTSSPPGNHSITPDSRRQSSTSIEGITPTAEAINGLHRAVTVFLQTFVSTPLPRPRGSRKADADMCEQLAQAALACVADACESLSRACSLGLPIPPHSALKLEQLLRLVLAEEVRIRMGRSLPVRRHLAY